MEALPKLINSVSDLLYIIDILEGHEWAKECVGLHTVGGQMRKLLNWPPPRRKRIFAKITAGW